MPKRPPKEWWDSCVEGVKESESDVNPSAVCGDLWYHKKSKKERNKIIREERRKRK